MQNVGVMKSNLKPEPLVKPVRRLDRYAEHEWHKHLNEKRAKQEQVAKQLTELRAKGHIINILA